MAQATEELVKTIKKPWKAAYDLVNKIPDQKQKYTNMQENRVDYANKTFRDAAEKKSSKGKKKVSGGTKPTAPKTIKKKAPAKKYTSTKR